MALFPGRKILSAGSGALLPYQIDERNRAAQGAGTGAGQQVGDLLQQLAPLLAKGGAAGAAGGAAGGAGGIGGLVSGVLGGGAGGAAGAVGGAAAGAGGLAAAAGPIGMALAAGSMVNGVIKKATTDEDGFAKTSKGALVARGVGGLVDPIGTVMGGISNLKRDDLTGFQKFRSFIPGQAALATKDADIKAREKYQQQKLSSQVQQASLASQNSYYQGPVAMRRGGKIAVLAEGGRTAAAKASGPNTRKPAVTPATVLESRALEEQSAGTQKDWTLDYINSPMYRQRLIKEQNGGDYKPTRENQLQAYGTQQQRAARVQGGNTHFVDQIAYKPQVYLGLNTLDPNVVKEDPTFSSIKGLPVKANDIVLERNLPDRYSTSPAHEYSHQSTMATKGLSDFARIGIGQRIAPGTSEYLSKPTEIKARMDAVRYQLQQEGIYNAGTQEFNQEVLDKARLNPAVRGNQNFIELEQILKGKNGKADDNLLWMFNNVASVRKPGAANVMSAAQGGKIKKTTAVSKPDSQLPVLRPLPKGNPHPTTAYERNREQAYSIKADLENARASEQGKNVTENVLNGLGLLRAVPTPMTQAVGWGASGLGAVMDGNDARLAYQKGNKGEAAVEVASAVANLLPIKLSSAGRFGNIDLLKKGTQTLAKRQANNAVFHGAQTVNAAADGTDFGQMLGKTFSFKDGGFIKPPRSIIASGALHSERNQVDGKRGIPVLAADGTKIAEIERDELTLHHEPTKLIEGLRDSFRQSKDLVHLQAIGRVMADELKLNTAPSKRFQKRLAK